MSTLTDSPEFTSNEVYEIAITDPCQGAGVGAAFGGLGIHNQPHQQLANRTAFLYGRQNTNIANINFILAFLARQTSRMIAGWSVTPVTDVDLGTINVVRQWGYVNLAGDGASGDTEHVVDWPIAFPNACKWASGMMTYRDSTSPDVGIGLRTDANGNPLLTTTQGTFFLNLFNANGNVGGFFWEALGY